MRQRHRKSISNIDVTPLVDLTFILLITFMITMPAIEGRVKLPPLKAAKANKENKEITININEHGSISVKGEAVNKEDLISHLQNFDTDGKDFTLRADKNLPYGDVIAVLKLARDAGVDNIALGTAMEAK